jgi:hypothetical protein
MSRNLKYNHKIQNGKFQEVDNISNNEWKELHDVESQ